MASFEERLAEEVRKYRDIYDTSDPDYKDFRKSNNSWREISTTLGIDETTCRTKWKYLRDRFSRHKRKMKGKGGVGAPGIYQMLSWLDSFVKNRETNTNVPNEDSSDSSSPSVPAHITLDIDSYFAPISPSPSPPCGPALLQPSPSVLLQAPTSAVHPPPSASPVRSPKTAISPPTVSTSPNTPISPPTVSPISFPETSAPSSQRKRKDTSKTDDAIKKRLEDVDRCREERALKQDAEVRFASTVADMLMRLPLSMRSVAQFKVHELLFNMEQEYLRSLKQSSRSQK